MGEVFDCISSDLSKWLSEQQMFFVATAPLSELGHVNCSPKGLDSFRVINPNSCCYLDLTGSGAETIAHLRENGRIVLMFCAFSGPPKIVRLYGVGHVHREGTGRFNELVAQFSDHIGKRTIITVDLSRVSISCGYGVPEFGYVGQRETLTRYSDAKGVSGLSEYRQEKNRESIDGLPALD